ncbi:uncharacterized protein JCM6883_006179 [Sporobolomyces salmoneus]|uniref:uncharacterized protein n=1 Tax=Sporobolomyces salmoneus TaxID=183962 RepID=UPI00316CFBF7
MPLFEWHHRRMSLSCAAPPAVDAQREKTIPSLAIHVEDHDAIPFPSVSAPASPRLNNPLLSRIRRVASCLSFSRSRSSSSSTISATPITRKRETSSISTSFPRPIPPSNSTKKRGGLKSCISYPVLRSASSPMLPYSSESEASWGMRDSYIEKKERKERGGSESSSFEFEDILGSSLCPPNLFPRDSRSSSGSLRSSMSSEGEDDNASVSLSLFDDESLLFRSPLTQPTYYPHQPQVDVSYSRSPSRSQSISSTIEGGIEEDLNGFSFVPTPSSSRIASPVATPARSIIFKLDDTEEEEEEEQTPPATPKLTGKVIEASPSSFLALPPVDSMSLSQELRRDSNLFERNSGQWLSPTSSPLPESRRYSTSHISPGSS